MVWLAGSASSAGRPYPIQKSLSRDSAQPREDALAKNQNTFEKRRREMQKKRKAEEKRERRQKRKEEVDQPVDAEAPVVEEPEAASS
jgi:hypothetical protein